MPFDEANKGDPFRGDFRGWPDREPLGRAVKEGGAHIVNLSLGCQTQENMPLIAIQAALEIISEWEFGQALKILPGILAGPDCLSVYHRRPAVLCVNRRDSRDLAVPDPPFCRRMVHTASACEVSRLVRASHDQRECNRQVGQGWQVLPVDPHTDSTMQQCTTVNPVDILRAEFRQALRDRLAELSARDQWLLQLCAADPRSPMTRSASCRGCRSGASARPSAGALTGCGKSVPCGHTGSSSDRRWGKGGDQRELAELG